MASMILTRLSPYSSMKLSTVPFVHLHDRNPQARAYISCYSIGICQSWRKEAHGGAPVPRPPHNEDRSRAKPHVVVPPHLQHDLKNSQSQLAWVEQKR